LDQNAKGIRDGKLLVIQRYTHPFTRSLTTRHPHITVVLIISCMNNNSTVVPETLTEDHVLVYVRQWHPVEFQLAAPLEVLTRFQSFVLFLSLYILIFIGMRVI
jgi:hypothetical protein